MTELLVSPICNAQIPSAARVMANAFSDAPRFRFLVPIDAQRPAKLRWYWGASMRACIHSGGLVFVAHERSSTVLGVAIWNAPGQSGHSTPHAPAVRAVGGPDAARHRGLPAKAGSRICSLLAGVTSPCLVSEMPSASSHWRSVAA